MANGTIAFDTLTTSDSVNTGTEKSIDTSYLFNGVAKHWINLEGDASGAGRAAWPQDDGGRDAGYSASDHCAPAADG